MVADVLNQSVKAKEAKRNKSKCNGMDSRTGAELAQ